MLTTSVTIVCTELSVAVQGNAMSKRQSHKPRHPGDVLKREFIERLGISQYLIAKSTGVPPRRINEIVHGKRGITPDTALRLARFFDTSDQYWLDLQMKYDLEKTKNEINEKIKSEIKPYESK